MEKRWIKFYSGESFPDRDSVYDFLVSKLCETAEGQLLLKDKLYYREEIGSIQIEEQVVLPHLQYEGPWQGIIILRLKTPIKIWSEGIDSVKLVICLVISEEMEENAKKKIRSFVRKLSRRDFFQFLLQKEESIIEAYLEQGDL
ncbi:PTS sugar transporter subunit IIA [Streptococcus merionis]|uniref:Putative PTS system, EIIA component n=1 Tax=Streptococcus merionis TaxID=400065 RepID=A0A239SXJ7_9STRE|nr:PTS sugar transporter subunit IIA [Streptococcus merionis]SNU89313.1 Putative PTS system, EIIA component [Streptococcus merionis]